MGHKGKLKDYESENDLLLKLYTWELTDWADKVPFHLSLFALMLIICN